MIKEIKPTNRRIVGYVILALLSIAMFCRFIVNIVLFTRLNPWFFHGKTIAKGYIICSLITMILTILGIILLLVRSFVNFNALDNIGECCGTMVSIFQCLVNSLACSLFCNCDGCFSETFSWISWFCGWVTFAFGTVNSDRDFDGNAICGGQFVDLFTGLTIYIAEHPEKKEEYLEWFSNYSLYSVCHGILNPFCILLVIEFFCQIALGIVGGCCDCCCCKKEGVNNDQNQSSNENKEIQPDNNMQPNYNNMPPNYNNMPPFYNNMPPNYNNMPPNYNNMPPNYNNMPPFYNNMPPNNFNMQPNNNAQPNNNNAQPNNNNAQPNNNNNAQPNNNNAQPNNNNIQQNQINNDEKNSETIEA